MRPTRTVSAQRVPETVFRIPHPLARTKENNPDGLFSVLAEGIRSRITKYICSSSTPNLLSVLDPTSLACGIVAVFESHRKTH